MIEIDQITYTYPNAARPVLHNLSLRIGEGEFLLVCGRSGAGKSTFMRLLNGLVPHFHGGRISGDVRVWGRSTVLHQPRDMADLVGFVFQDPEAQFVVDVVEDEIVFGMENLGLSPRVMRRRVEEVLDQLGIAHLRHRRVSSLSGGERQRVAIAAVLAMQPRALVLDEPTSQLDPHAAEEVLTALQKLNADLGLTIVLSEHRLERVIQYADRVLFLVPPQPTGSDEQHGATEHPSSSLVVGPPRDVLAQIDLAPPLIALGKALGWSPLPLTIKQGHSFARTFRKPNNCQGPSTDDPSSRRSVSSGRPPAVAVSHVHFSYGEQEALYDLNLTAHRGEVLALMGRNGSGKTTLLKLLAGLLKPQHGTLRAFGHDLAQMAVEDVAALAGYVPQDPRTLLFHDTLREELAFTLKGRRQMRSQRRFQPRPPEAIDSNAGPGVPTTSDDTAIDATLAQFDLLHLAPAYPRDLSGGEAQRAALAAIMVGNPQLLLLDEPTRGLDYHAKTCLGSLLRELASAGRAIIMSTHDVELVAAYADRVALLGDGELVVEGPVREVMSDSLFFSSQVAKLFPGTGWLTVEDVLAHQP